MNDIFNSAKNGVLVWVIFNFNVPVSFTYWHWLINEIYFILCWIKINHIIENLTLLSKFLSCFIFDSLPVFNPKKFTSF